MSETKTMLSYSMKLFGPLTQCRRLMVTLSFLAAAHASAFDPGGPPPQWTQINTVAFMNRIVLPSVQYQQVTVEEALEFLQATRPAGYMPALGVDTALQNSTTAITIREEDITLMDLLALIAEQAHADILIAAGKVTLQTRQSSPAPKTP